MSTTNKRVANTKKAISDALLSLLESKPKNKISIKELSEAAGINRKTFYAHYSCIEDVLLEMEDEIVTNISDFVKSCVINEYGLNPYLFIQFVHSIYLSNPAFFETITSERNYHYIAEKIKHVFKEQILETMNIPDDKMLETNFQIEFYLSDITSVYVEWQRMGKPCAFEKVTEFLINTSMEEIKNITFTGKLPE